MELFNNTGFLPQDKVFVIIEGKKYFGTVIEIDNNLERVRVDYTGKGTKAVEWFSVSFWTKITN